jgi:N-acetylmuramoyl-L-alanine amidase
MRIRHIISSVIYPVNAEAMTIVQRPLTISKYSRSGLPLFDVLGLVIHWTAKPKQTPDGVWRYYESEEAAIEHYGSAHYIIGFDGEIIQAIPENEAAMHVGSAVNDPVSGLVYTDIARALFPGFCSATTSPNRVTLGIELCTTNIFGEFVQKTIASAVELSKDICKRHNLWWGRLVRHYDVVGWKDCPRWFVNNPAAWLAFKMLVFPRSPSAVENEKSGR